MKAILLFLSSLLLFISCKQESSIDLESGSSLKLKANGLSYKDVDLLINGEKGKLKVFDFGDELAIRLNDVEGLKRVNGACFPGVSMLVLNEQKDTVLFYDDLFAGEEGEKENPIALIAKLKLADPIYSNKIHTMKLHFWDKKGNGTIDVEMEFSVKSNENIKVKARDLMYDEVYLVNPQNSDIIKNSYTDSSVIVLNIEGLKGFKQTEEDKIFPCLSINVKNKKGEIVFESPNILQDYFETGIDPVAVNDRIFFSLDERFTIPQNDLVIHAVLFDKLSDANLIIDVNLRKQ
jgi:hypothetical protein